MRNAEALGAFFVPLFVLVFRKRIPSIDMTKKAPGGGGGCESEASAAAAATTGNFLLAVDAEASILRTLTMAAQAPAPAAAAVAAGSCIVVGAEADGVAPSILLTVASSKRQYLFGCAEGFSRLALVGTDG